MATLSGQLPLSWQSCVCVGVDEERMDVLRAVIFAPPDTPYACGAFAFDIHVRGLQGGVAGAGQSTQPAQMGGGPGTVVCFSQQHRYHLDSPLPSLPPACLTACLQLPPAYPNAPPLVQFLTTGEAW